MKGYIAIDNGVSGSIGIIDGLDRPSFFTTPIVKELNYTRAKQWINRLDVTEFTLILNNLKDQTWTRDWVVLLERPMVNPMRFKASVSAVRCLEATITVLESLGLPKPSYYVDSKEWQKVMLPRGITGSDELKKASLDVGRRLFPTLAMHFKKDADSILMAEWARRNNK